MSQFLIDVSIAPPPIPPTVATSYVTDANSPAIPSANVLDVVGGTSSINNVNGIQTDGSSGSDVLTVQLTNRLQGTGTTVGSSSAIVVTFSLGVTPASYVFEFNVTGFDGVTPTSTGYWFVATARTNGSSATVVGSSETFNEDTSLSASDVDMIASGNNVTLVVTGVTGVTLNWDAVGTYVKAQ